ncbi:hypothetical protein [Phenylobacterium sp.]|uniref:hypothetical protein n=1 Tax=Phenylobacterium sp. TaxID=1871053 RepID=UPI0035B49872
MNQQDRDHIAEPQDAVLDAIAFGVSGSIQPYRPGLPRLIRDSLIASGHQCEADEHPNRIVLLLSIEDDVGLTAELVFSENPSQRRIELTPNSELRINPMRVLARRLGPAAGLEGSLDGNDNHLGPTEGRGAEVLSEQEEVIRGAIDAFAQALSAALPPDVDFAEERLWLRSCEACTDLAVGDAVKVVEGLQHAVLSGTQRTVIDAYRVSVETGRSLTALRWWRQETGPCAKVYPKTENQIRVEVAAPNRRAMRVLDCGGDGEVDGDNAVDLVRAYVAAVTPLLGEARNHVQAAASGADGSPVSLVRKLRPLFDLMEARETRVGRPTGAVVVFDAVRAASDLLTHGRFRAAHLRHGTTIRRVLDELSGPEGPLIRDGLGPVYSLKPRYARGAHRLVAKT